MVVTIADPSRGMELNAEFAATRPPAPGICKTIIEGFPGRWRPIWRATICAYRLAGLPGAVPTVMDSCLPEKNAKLSSFANAIDGDPITKFSAVIKGSICHFNFVNISFTKCF